MVYTKTMKIYIIFSFTLLFSMVLARDYSSGYEDPPADAGDYPAYDPPADGYPAYDPPADGYPGYDPPAEEYPAYDSPAANYPASSETISEEGDKGSTDISRFPGIFNLKKRFPTLIFKDLIHINFF